MTKLKVSPSPHDENYTKTSHIMLNVVLALMPALAVSCYVFGLRALLLTAVCVAGCVSFEYICRRIMKRDNTIDDLSAVVTGVILAMNLPVTLPLWIALIGSFVAIVIVKQLFGGLGQNFANPAITARIVLMVSFPAQMSHWAEPFYYQAKGGLSTSDVVTAATPLVTGDASYKDLFLGHVGGCLGETCALALIIGGIYLIARKVISPAIPLTYIGTVALIMLIAGKGDLGFVAYQVMGGGLLLGAFFMATDYSTCPIKVRGKIIFGVGCGIITALIRLFASMTEGVSFAILIMNLLVPFIDRATIPKPFGTPKKEKKSKEAAN